MTIAQTYKNMLAEHPQPWCWWCGRGFENKPSEWYGRWNIDRAHIVNNPRREDRRAVILLCTWCHDAQHGGQIILPGCDRLSKPTIQNMLWLKKAFDFDWYDRTFLSTCCIGILPRAVKPPKEVLDQYRERR